MIYNYVGHKDWREIHSAWGVRTLGELARMGTLNRVGADRWADRLPSGAPGSRALPSTGSWGAIPRDLPSNA